ncbi:MAG: polysaccharide biosynthesis/export family protein [Planctomycetaceae bacterium]|nr:polysaccharide biosynthesis/export family protein [Planctomycetaceae bacterium]
MLKDTMNSIASKLQAAYLLPAILRLTMLVGSIALATLAAQPACAQAQVQANMGCSTCQTSLNPAPSLMLVQPQAYYGGCPNCMRGIDCRDHCGQPVDWSAMRPIDFQPLLHGEFIGPIRLPAMVDYRMRAGDQLQFVYILNREQRIGEYRLQVGDQVRISFALDPNLTQGDLNRGVEILPDGTLILNMIGAVPAAGLTLPQLRSQLLKSYSTYIKNLNEDTGVSLDVIPVKINTKLEDLRNAVTNLGGFNSGQAVNATIMPDGKVDLPLIGPVMLQGMTRDEIKTEVNLRYESVVAGMVVEPRLLQIAPRRVFVFGEVREPGVYNLEGPTTVTQALAQAKGVLVGGNDRQIIIFRRAEDWRLVATKLDLRGAHLGKDPTPADEIWLRDSDLIIVPRTPMKLTNDFVRQVFTQGIYGVVPFGGISIQLGNVQ